MKQLPKDLERVLKEVIDVVEIEGSQKLSDADIVVMKLLKKYQDLDYSVETHCRRYIQVQREIGYEVIGEIMRNDK